MELQTLRDLYIHELKDLYSAEQQLVKALPKVAKAATNPDLKAGIEAHLEETIEHVNRLETILSGLGESTRGPKCKGMEGLLEEAAHLIDEEPDEEVLDAGIIAGAQKVEHYEMASYGCVRTYAELLGEEEAVTVLQSTLDEERATDEKLTELAMSAINVAAADNEEGGEESGTRSQLNPAPPERAPPMGSPEKSGPPSKRRTPLHMPNVGFFTASDPLPPKAQISIRYTVEVEGLPVYTELYDVRKLAAELKKDREKALEAWTRRLEAPVLARREPEFSARVTAHLHRGKPEPAD